MPETRIGNMHFQETLKQFDALRDDDLIQSRTVNNIEPECADEWPMRLEESVRKALNELVPRPYRHQVDAIDKALDGADVVMESPTASGKTLAFAAPMFDAIKRNRGSHALMIYPMKALAFDQRMQIQGLCRRLGIESWPYDGDTSEEEKKVIRENPTAVQILLTNPEYLNAAFCGWHEKWTKFLQNLRYVIIDEMHEYRGFFGSNMSLLLRRFFLLLEHVGASPQVFLSTATCANPEEHALALTGRESVSLVSARDVIRPRRHFIFVKPQIPDYRYLDIIRLRAQNAALAALNDGLQVLVFCPSKRFLEDACRGCKDEAEKRGLEKEKIVTFHADMKNDGRQRIQEKIKSCEINIVFTTNALELGVDIGGLDGIICMGFPSSIMSAWQQIGRAGRRWDKNAFVLFYAMNDPIDQFFGGNLDAFLNKPFDQLVIDPANEELIDRHLPSLCAETGGKLNLSAEKILGSSFYKLAKKKMGKPAKGYRPQPGLSMRGGIGKSFELKADNQKLGQISEMRRFREAYIGAIFTFVGKKYRVHSHEENAVVLENTDPNTRTEPSFFTNLSTTEPFRGYRYGDLEISYGSLSIGSNFNGYKLLNEETGEEIKGGGDHSSYYQDKLHAFWMRVPPSEEPAGVGALEHMLRVGAMFVIPADRFDTSTFSKTGDDLSIYYYENYSGGIGVAKKLFKEWQQALRKGMEIANHCKCSLGCQNCIEPAKSYNMSNSEIDKKQGVILADELFAMVANGPDEEWREGMWMKCDRDGKTNDKDDESK